MRDNKIIKALEYLTYGGNFCLRCEHKIITGDNRCGIDGCNIAKKALDLINRLEAEIERLECSIISQDEEKLSYAAMLIISVAYLGLTVETKSAHSRAAFIRLMQPS